eukprot:2627577-Rhodomonas_salina.1
MEIPRIPQLVKNEFCERLSANAPMQYPIAVPASAAAPVAAMNDFVLVLFPHDATKVEEIKKMFLATT